MNAQMRSKASANAELNISASFECAEPFLDSCGVRIRLVTADVAMKRRPRAGKITFLREYFDPRAAKALDALLVGLLG